MEELLRGQRTSADGVRLEAVYDNFYDPHCEEQKKRLVVVFKLCFSEFAVLSCRTCRAVFVYTNRMATNSCLKFEDINCSIIDKDSFRTQVL